MEICEISIKREGKRVFLDWLIGGGLIVALVMWWIGLIQYF